MIFQREDRFLLLNSLDLLCKMHFGTYVIYKTKKMFVIIDRILVIIFFNLLIVSCTSQSHNKFNIPNQGFIGNADSAIKIAEKVWLSAYGNGIYNSRPFVAQLKGSVWYISGTLNYAKEAFHS